MKTEREIDILAENLLQRFQDKPASLVNKSAEERIKVLQLFDKLYTTCNSYIPSFARVFVYNHEE